MKKKIIGILICTLLVLFTFTVGLMPTVVQASVTNYEITCVAQTGINQITVSVKAQFCTACNPNYLSMPGDPAFPTYTWWIDGRFVAVRIKDANTGTILGNTQKLVCNPTNWPLNDNNPRIFVFDDITLTGISTVIVESDIYCSWCGHWYPSPKTLQVTPLRVCIDAGHDEDHDKPFPLHDSTTPDSEAFLTLDMAKNLQTLLEDAECEVIMTRETEACPGEDLNGNGNVDLGECLRTRCDIANEANCNIFVSIHCDAAGAAAKGTSTWIYDYLGQYFPEVKDMGEGTSSIWNGNTDSEEKDRCNDSFELASWVQKKLTNKVGTFDRGVKSDTVSGSGAIYVVRGTSMPAALIEVAFKTNPDDAAKLNNPTFRLNAAMGIAMGITEYFVRRGITLDLLSPVDVVVTDPDGLIISKEVNEIPGATYNEIDIDGDGDLDDQIRIPDRKIGNYIIEISPEPGASPTDTYTLKVSLFGVPIILAENIQISDIPSDPYIIESTPTGISLPIIPATLKIEPETLNRNSSGKWITCYIELPNGYNVEDINISTIILNEVVQAEDHPTDISDFDEDGMPDLMVKFDRQDVIAILEPGNNIAITVSGKLLDDTLFEGTDYINVI